MNITGTIVHYYLYCHRKCWLSLNKLSFESNSEEVSIGKALHEEYQRKNKNTEIVIDNIKLDAVTSQYVIEIKKSNADKESARWQLLYYLYILDGKGVKKKGKLIFIEKKSKGNKIEIIELTDNLKTKIKEILNKIEILKDKISIPEINNNITKCKQCSYYEYCFI